MAKTDIIKDGIYVATEIGSNIYLWHAPGTKPNRDRECVITSHGSEITSLAVTQHRAPSVLCYFYGPHGYALSDAQSVGVLRKNSRYYEKKVPSEGGVHDYILTKAQGSSENSKETYADIQRNWHKEHMVQAQDKMTARMLSEVKPTPWADKSREAIRAQHNKNLESLTDIVTDAVTIRDRKFPHMRKTVTLFSVINALEKAGFLYKAYHCNFCRGGDADHSHQIMDNPHSHAG